MLTSGLYLRALVTVSSELKLYSTAFLVLQDRWKGRLTAGIALWVPCGPLRLGGPHGTHRLHALRVYNDGTCLP